MTSVVDTVRLASFGMLFLLAAQAVWLYAMDLSRHTHAWVGSWCCAAAFVLLFRHYQANADDAAAATFALRAQLVGVALALPLCLGAASSLADRRPARWALIAIAIASAVIAILSAVTDLVVAPLGAPDAPIVPTAWGGNPGPLFPIAIALFVVVGVSCAEILRRHGFRSDPASRIALTGATVFIIVAILSDTLLADSSAHVPQLREFALGGMALAVSLVLSRHDARELAGTRHSAAVRAETIGVLTRAQEQERRSLAHLLHQSTSQSLTTLVLRLQALETDAPPDEIAEEVEELRALAKATAEEVRGLARSLRPVLVDDLGLQVVLERFAAELATEHNIECDVQVYGVDSSLPEWLGIVLFRTAQDVVATVRRRGQAGSLSIVVDRSDTGVRLIVEQDAVLSAGSRDLEILRERATLYGGDVTVETSEALGTSIYVDFPLLEPSDQDG